MGGTHGTGRASSGNGAAATGDVQQLAGATEALSANLGQVMRGKPEAIRLAMIALLSGGHLLVEDVPGVGKTLLAKALPARWAGRWPACRPRQTCCRRS